MAKTPKDPVKDLTSDSIRHQFKTLKQIGGAQSQMVYRDKNDQPLAAVIFVVGKEETAAVIAAVEKVSDSWHEKA